MAVSNLLIIVLFLTVFPLSGLAVTSLTDERMTTLLNEGGAGLAVSYAPVWHFSQVDDHPPCYPTWAFGGSPTSPDIYKDYKNHKTPSAPLCTFPDVGCKCRNPNTPMGGQGPAFPIYYTYIKCPKNQNEVRVAYNLFYEKDGGSGGWVFWDWGHVYDWEDVIVVLNKDKKNMWTPTKIEVGIHGKYYEIPWASLLTLSEEDIKNNKVIGNNKRGTDDHPKIFPSWSLHSMYTTPFTFFKGALYQSTGYAWRGENWWKFVESNYYIRADRSTDAGTATGNTNWGKADSTPPKVHDKICDIKGLRGHDELLVKPSRIKRGMAL